MTHPIKQQRSTRRSKEEWLAIYDQWKKSKISPRAFCRAQKIPYTTFLEKKHQLERKSIPKKPSFIELDDTKDEREGQQLEPLILSAGHLQIQLSANTTPALIIHCLRALKEVY